MKVIDIHTHGIGGYDTRTTAADELLEIAQIHGACGVSEIVLTLYPATIKIMRNNMDIVRKAMEKQKNILPPLRRGDIGRGIRSAQIIGLHLEGPFLNPAQCGALQAASFIAPDENNLQELVDGFEDIIKIITLAPELSGAIEVIRRISDMGIVVSMGHSNATYAEAENGFHAGAKGITHIFNAMRGFHHREPGIAGFGLLNRDIFIEVIADLHHLDARTLELIFKVKHPDRILLVSDTVKETKKDLAGMAIRESSGRLLGGSVTVTEATGRLIQMGYDRDVIMGYITINPEQYLTGK
jgi:N-acetylglucosamine-6-phosphate deacetylase